MSAFIVQSTVTVKEDKTGNKCWNVLQSQDIVYTSDALKLIHGSHNVCGKLDNDVSAETDSDRGFI